MIMSRKSKKTTDKCAKEGNSLRSKHPRIRRLAVKLGDIMDSFLFVYFAILILLTLTYVGLIILAVLLKWYTFEEVASTAKSYISIGWTVLSAIAVPIAVNEVSRRKDTISKRYERNKELYLNFSSVLIELLRDGNNCHKNAERVKDFFVKNYSEMAITWPQSLIWDAEELYEECRYNCSENIKFYAKRCIMKIRKEAGLRNDFSLNQAFIDLFSSKRS